MTELNTTQPGHRVLVIGISGSGTSTFSEKLAGRSCAAPPVIKLTKPFLCCFSDGDPVTRGGQRLFVGRVPGTANQPHTTLHGGHFTQEDDPQGFVSSILKAVKP